MRILIAGGGVGSRRLLPTSRTGWGHEAVVATDGLEARAALRQPDAPKRAVLDGVMPGLERFTHGICPMNALEGSTDARADRPGAGARGPKEREAQS